MLTSTRACSARSSRPTRRSVQVTLDLGEGIPLLPLIYFDIVVQNLIQNALDAMPNGGRLVITTCAVIHKKLGGGYFQLTVKDDGPGIPPEVRKRVFELNFTTKGTQGAGLGPGPVVGPQVRPQRQGRYFDPEYSQDGEPR